MSPSDLVTLSAAVSHRVSFVFLAVLVGILACPSAAYGKNLALLVGVTKYEHLEDGYQLDGPANDVKQFEELLKGRFGRSFAEAAITVLAEDRGDDHRPTRDRIIEAFKRLAAQAKKDDLVVILLSGHGTQVPEDPSKPGGPAEWDGMDEVFLPCDAGKWEKLPEINGRKPWSIEGGIIDDELGAMLKAIDKTGAHTWIVFDTCCSGTMTRGKGDAEGERSRRIRPEDLGVPPAAIREARERASKIGKGARARGGFTCDPMAPVEGLQRTVAFYAAQPDEETPELALPIGQHVAPDNSNVYGLFSFNLVSALVDNQQPITYAELMQRVLARHRSASANTNHDPTPFAEGSLNQEVLGLKQWPPSSPILLTKEGDRLVLNAGALMGLTERSILAVFRPGVAREGASPIGHVSISEVSASSSTVDPCDSKGVDTAMFPWPPSGPDGDLGLPCELVFQDFGDMRLRIACADMPNSKAPGNSSGKNDSRFLNALLEKLGKAEGNLVEPCVRPCKADWYIAKDGDRVLVSSVNRRDDERSRGVFAIPTGLHLRPFTAADGDPATLVSAIMTELRKIYRWRNLTRLGGGGSRLFSECPDTGLSVELQTYTSEMDRDGQPLNVGELQVGQFVNIRLKNTGDAPLHVAVFYLYSDFGIRQCFPRAGYNEALAAKSEPVWVFDRPQPVVEPTSIAEHFLVIATPQQGQQLRPDLSLLLQEPLKRTAERSKGTRGDHAPSTGLGQFLDKVAFGSPTPEGSRGPGLGAKLPEGPSLITLRSFRVVGRRSPVAFSNEAFVCLTPTNVMRLLNPNEFRTWRPQVSTERSRGPGAELFAKIAPAVAVVRLPDGHGTGFFFSAPGFEEGYLLTNNHVVETASEVDEGQGVSTVQVHMGRMSESGNIELRERSVPAFILDKSPEKDLALLKLARIPEGFSKLPTIALSEKSPRPGESCEIVGHPRSGMLWSFRTGVVSQAGEFPGNMVDTMMQRLMSTSDEREAIDDELAQLPSRKVILSSCQVNPGDSGGPIANEDGQVIGVTFAIPSAAEDRAKTSYHVHLEEVKDFLKSARRTPLLIVPDAWDIGPRVELADLFENDRPQAIVGGADVPQQMIIDLDGDTPERVFASHELEQLRQGFDAEFAIHRTSTGAIAWYDTDNDGAFDLILADIDNDARADRSYVNSSGKDSWSIKTADGPLVDPTRFEVAQLQKAMKKLDRNLFASTRL